MPARHTLLAAMPCLAGGVLTSAAGVVTSAAGDIIPSTLQPQQQSQFRHYSERLQPEASPNPATPSTRGRTIDYPIQVGSGPLQTEHDTVSSPSQQDTSVSSAKKPHIILWLTDDQGWGNSKHCRTKPLIPA